MSETQGLRLFRKPTLTHGDPLTLQQLRQELHVFRADLRQLLDVRREALLHRGGPVHVEPPDPTEQPEGEDIFPDAFPLEGPSQRPSFMHSHPSRRASRMAFSNGSLSFAEWKNSGSVHSLTSPAPSRESTREIFMSTNQRGRFEKLIDAGNDEDDDVHASPAPSPRGEKHATIRVAASFSSCTRSDFLEWLMGLLIVLNTALIGYQAHWEIEHPRDPDPPSVPLMEQILCLAFFAEISARLLVERCGFFVGEHQCWNLFDASLVLLQASEAFLKRWNMADLSTLRLLRLIRLVRLIRLFVTFDQLSAILDALSCAFDSLLWAMVSIFMIISVASICTLHGILHFEKTEHVHVVVWFGGMGRTMLTMFECITSGVSWDDVARPLFEEVSPIIGMFLCSYVIVGLVFMMNLVTGIFVEQVIRSAVENRDKIMVQRISEHILGDGDGTLTDDEMDNVITKEVFVEKMQHPAMQDYFRAIDVPAASAPKLFDLFDVDGNGTVDREEIVNGCLSFRGNAKGLDVNVMLRAINGLRSAQDAEESSTNRRRSSRGIAPDSPPSRTSKKRFSVLDWQGEPPPGL